MNQGMLGYPLGTDMNSGLLGFPLGRTPGADLVTVLGTNLALSEGTAVVADVSINTKGAWATISEATPHEAYGFWLELRTKGNNNEALLDVGVGPAGQEQIIISNIQISNRASERTFLTVYCPLRIRAGERVAARCQSVVTVASYATQIRIARGPSYRSCSYRYSETFGADETDSQGTQVDPGGAANTKGAWTAIGDVSTLKIMAIMACLSQRNNGANSVQRGLLDIGVGPSGSQVVLMENIAYTTSNSEDIYPSWSALHYVPQVPAGALLWARAQSTLTSSPNRLIDVTVVTFS